MAKNIYDKIIEEREFTGRVYTYINYALVKAAGYPESSFLHLCMREGRLAHRSVLPRCCAALGPGDMFDCYYVFGETLLHTQHGFGECPYLKGTAKSTPLQKKPTLRT